MEEHSLPDIQEESNNDALTKKDPEKASVTGHQHKNGVKPDEKHVGLRLKLPDQTGVGSSGAGNSPSGNKPLKSLAASHTSLNVKGSMVTLDKVSSGGGGKDGFTARQKVYIITIVIAKFVHQLCTFWGAMVYPLEATKRGYQKFEIGIMIIFVSIISWLSSIYLSTSFLKFGGRRAAYNLFVSGSLGYGILTVAVALCSLTNDKLLFGLLFTTLFALRGMAQASLFSSINTILLSDEFADKISLAKALDTLAYTLGSIFSFALSGFLYAQFGFAAVVIILGGFQSCVSCSYFFILPTKTSQTDTSKDKVVSNMNMSLVRKFLALPQMVSTLLCHCVTYFSLFYLAPIFTPYIENEFGISAGLTGLIASLPYLSMSVFGTLWSYLASTRTRRKLCLVIPLSAFGVLTWFSGPDPWIATEASLLSLSLAFFLGGGFLVSNLVLNTPELRDIAEDAGFDTEDLQISATLASLLTSFEFLGDVLGPPCGGLFADLTNERRAFSIGGTIVLSVSFIRVLVYLYSAFALKRKMRDHETWPSSQV